MSNYLNKSINELHDLLVKKEITPLMLVEEALERVANDKLNCFITVDKEGALKKAKSLTEPEEGNILWGIPIALKDNIVTKDMRTTAGSKMLEDFMSVYDAHVVDLINEKNMVIIGKLNMDEFAMGSSNQTSYFGPVRNPYNLSLVPGGSSGGSAAAVSSRIVPFALGSDTGGSIRQPSAFCGTVGMKPTYGSISRYGLIAFASSLDQIGPISRNVYENALLLNILCGKDERDLTQSGREEDFTRLIGEDIKGMKIAVPKFYISDIIDKEVLVKFNETRELLESFGVTIDEVDVPYIDFAVPLYQIIALGEASSNLARFDGIKYGFKENENDAISSYKKTRSMGFGEEVKRRIMVGSFLLSGENVSYYYDKALKIRKSISNSFEELFKDYDLVIGPTTTCLPYEIGEHLEDPNRSFVDDVLVIPVNMAGLPGMSLPVGFSKDNLPIGMHIIGNKNSEAVMYKFASFIEKELALPLGGGIYE